MIHKHMYGANIHTIVVTVLWDNCACLCPAVLLLTFVTRTKCSFQRQWSGGGGGAVACNHVHQKAQQKCVLVDVDRICHSAESQTDTVVMYQAALGIQPKHKGRLSNLHRTHKPSSDRNTTSWPTSNLYVCSQQPH